jgi:hypothetical protein
MMKNSIMALLAASGLLVTGCSTARHSDRWEYKTVLSTSDEVLNTPVAEGWSVVGFSASDSGNKWFLLRRLKQ